jgi:phospholipid/cholesterol/gamma-HCH transport system permease protein
MVAAAGAPVIKALRYAGGLSYLLADTAVWIFRGLFAPNVQIGRPAVAAQMVRVGVRSLGIVALVQGFIGVVLALQMAPPLALFGQEKTIADIIGVAGFRMLAPIFTGIILSGFAGASIAAELGTMVVAEEIEAMQAMAMNPVRYLVVPRVLATAVMTVLLSGVSNVMIALGGYFTARLALGSGVWQDYWVRMADILKYRDLVTGLIQAGVFGVLISAIACYEGLSVRGGAEGVGRATTMTVVYSIVAIVAAACLCTMVFYAFGL